jgi:hypothetical protein
MEAHQRTFLVTRLMHEWGDCTAALMIGIQQREMIFSQKKTLDVLEADKRFLWHQFGCGRFPSTEGNGIVRRTM